MTTRTDDSRQVRIALLDANAATVDAEVAKACAGGQSFGDVVAIVADLREPLAQPLVAAAAERHGISVDLLLARIATPFGKSARTTTCALPRTEAVAFFATSYPQLSQALAQFSSPDRVSVVVIAGGSAALASKSPPRQPGGCSK